ncbi:hypothetical protein [Vibrio japonicus]|uniref:Uncharacterized protein n=1 Tax=Vibrio japonicus TaxID=1824638 RepID=A0ABY5LHW0_9VIBR|nr:hypothetical protein [Vibrio japonicus]UUM31622.1 hypothetical protein NP165_05675 [Vibrio japonicus]
MPSAVANNQKKYEQRALKLKKRENADEQKEGLSENEEENGCAASHECGEPSVGSIIGVVIFKIIIMSDVVKDSV